MITRMELPIPSMITEQLKIAGILSSLDDIIASEVQQLETLKHHKRGLMQGLFPAASEADR